MLGFINPLSIKFTNFWKKAHVKIHSVNFHVIPEGKVESTDLKCITKSIERRSLGDYKKFNKENLLKQGEIGVK